jgi:hypothetical protein
MKRKIYKIVSLFILFIFICWCFCSCSILGGALEKFLFGETYGPYHHDALITMPTKAVTVQEKTYCWFDNDIYEMKEGTFDFVSTRKDQDESFIYGVNDIQTDGEKLYIATAEKSKGVSVFSSDFVYQKTFVNGGVCSLLLDGDKIYYLSFAEDNSTLKELRCYDQTTEEDVYLTEGFKNNTYSVGERVIYSNEKGNLYWADEIEGVNQADDYILNCWMPGNGYESWQSLGFYYNGKTGQIKTSGQQITLTYGGEVKTYSLHGESFLYNRILVSDGKLLFGTIEYKPNDKCNYDFCICHVGTSNLFSYDFAMDTFNIRQTLKDEEYFIFFDDMISSYYSNGEVVRNGEAIAEVEKIEPYGEFIQWGTETKGGDTRISQSVFYDDGEKLYYLYIDNSKCIKDKYF